VPAIGLLDAGSREARAGEGIHQHAELTQVTEPVGSRSVGRWTHYQGHFAEALAILAPWLGRWGY